VEVGGRRGCVQSRIEEDRGSLPFCFLSVLYPFGDIALAREVGRVTKVEGKIGEGMVRYGSLR